VVALCITSTLWSPAAEAQRHHRGGRGRVFVGGYFYDPFYEPYPWWGPAAYPYDDAPVLHYTMEKLPAGEKSEPPSTGRSGARPPLSGSAEPVRQEGAFGTIAIRVQPAGAEVTIDGERWTGSGTDAPLLVQVPEGRHRVAVQKDGYRSFSTDIDVRRGETTPINVSLQIGR
jgi:hypothetical protein